MKIYRAAYLLFLVSAGIVAQNPGDTIKIQTFHYGSATRDTLINFPSTLLSFERVIMKYNMRCKNGLVSDGNNRNQGCGEWDYSCNTYIVDSDKVEKVTATQPEYMISNFSGTTFNYTTKPIYDYYRYMQNRVIVDSSSGENSYIVLNGSLQVNGLLNGSHRSGKTQMLYTAAELTAAGFTAGNIHALKFNVSNSGGHAHFFKLRMKQTTAGSFNSGVIDSAGLTELYHSDYLFTNGENRIQFKTPFTWDGSSNLIIEISYTNSTPQQDIQFTGTAGDSVMSLFTNNNYAVDLSELGHVILNTPALASIQNEISIGFWVYGNPAFLPANTAILYGYSNNATERQLNIHLPYSNSNVYFDCGFSAGGYDRIQNVSTAAEQGGRWNYWTFTKNASTGNMRIYLNGVLWFSSSGKTKPISLINLILGKNSDLALNYKGKVNELSIWNKELTAADISGIMRKVINANHPYYANLVAYYRMNEGSGQSIKDNKSLLSADGVNLFWKYDRGDQLNRMFSASLLRPNITLLQGTYSITVNDTTVTDSVIRNANMVTKYSIQSNEGTIPLANDIIKTDTVINTWYQSGYARIYNGDNGLLVDSISVAAEGTLNIANLNMIKRFPFYNEIMSFVTPYGIGLDLGPNGKSWYFDVTDFTPLFKGPKRIVMTLGGQNQEQMDVEFYFIVGTPARNVLEFNQIWQGAPRTGNAPIANINNDVQFPPVTIPTLSTGKYYKMRSTITGHGSEGEFESNGGAINHKLTFNGSAQQLNWSVSTPCSRNPVFPQGGTWIYERQGWCPGQASLLKEQNVTSFITPGSNITVDYNTSNPPVVAGTYQFLAAHQLVTYGDPNFSLDARLVEIAEPGNKILYGRSNPMCSRPRVMIENTGATTITSVTFEYWLNSASSVQTYTWTGSLANMKTTEVLLPIGSLWTNGIQPSNNSFHARITKVNGAADEYAYNNHMQSAFTIPDVVTGVFTIEVKTNNYPDENSYKLLNENGDVIDAKTFAAANTIYKQQYDLEGCYKLVFEDKGEDGISWWGNSSTAGNGFVRIRNASNLVVKTLQPDFGAGFEYSFTTKWALATEEEKTDLHVNVFPNPADRKFTITGNSLQDCSIQVFDLLGNEMELPVVRLAEAVEINTESLVVGFYMVSISDLKGNTSVKKVTVLH